MASADTTDANGDANGTGEASPPAPPKLTAYDVWKPVERRPLRQLPRLVGASIGLMWTASPREFVLVSVLQVFTGLATGVQLLLVKNLLDAITAAGTSHDFSIVVPWLLAIAVLT